MFELVVSGTFAGFAIVVFVRNKHVFAVRTEIAQRVAAAARADAVAGRSFDWRYDALDEVSYNEMLWKFWKPLKPEAWWANTDFLSGGAASRERTSG